MSGRGEPLSEKIYSQIKKKHKTKKDQRDLENAEVNLMQR